MAKYWKNTRPSGHTGRKFFQTPTPTLMAFTWVTPNAHEPSSANSSYGEKSFEYCSQDLSHPASQRGQAVRVQRLQKVLHRSLGDEEAWTPSHGLACNSARFEPFLTNCNIFLLWLKTYNHCSCCKACSKVSKFHFMEKVLVPSSHCSMVG